jgi:murein lipoprotein
MKKSLLVISIMLVLAVTLMGCATTGDLEKVQAQEKVINAKADQALQTSQDANANAIKAADAAARAENAVKMAEERAKMAEERAKIAEERAKKADAIFERSMKK